MKQLLLALVLALLVTPTALAQTTEIGASPDAVPIALAQASPGVVAAATLAHATETDAAVASEETSTTETIDDELPDAGELLQGVGKVADDWKALGWLAGMIALVNLLLNFLRLRILDDYLTYKKWKWLKPLGACLLGAALGGLSVFQTGASVPNSILAGVLAGMGSVGFHELMDKLRKRSEA